MRMRITGVALFAVVAPLTLSPGIVSGQFDAFRDRDRGGAGMPSSQFATFIEAGDFLVYPFYEYYRDRNAEYKPSELGYVGDVDYFGRARAHEGLLFLGYGL